LGLGKVSFMNKMAMKAMIVAIKDAKNAQPYPETG
jgi:hypothetical protein